MISDMDANRAASGAGASTVCIGIIGCGAIAASGQIPAVFVAGQQRTVAHSSDKARHLLGYTAR